MSPCNASLSATSPSWSLKRYKYSGVSSNYRGSYKSSYAWNRDMPFICACISEVSKVISKCNSCWNFTKAKGRIFSAAASKSLKRLMQPSKQNYRYTYTYAKSKNLLKNWKNTNGAYLFCTCAKIFVTSSMRSQNPYNYLLRYLVGTRSYRASSPPLCAHVVSYDLTKWESSST